MEDSSPYWSTVAQVVPVVAVALLLEYRAVAKAWSRKKSYKQSRRVRAVYGWFLFVMSLMLFLAFELAILGLMNQWKATDIWALVAELCLFFGVGVALIGPIITLSLALAGDSLEAWIERRWFSARSRARRRAMASQSEQRARLRAARSESLDRWIRYADNLRLVQRTSCELDAGRLQDAPDGRFRRHVDSSFEVLAEQRAALVELKKVLNEIEGLIDAVDQRIASGGDAETKRIKRARRVLAANLAALG